jgi:hypothetical protein
MMLEVDPPLQGPISIRINMFPYPIDLDVLYLKEWAIVRYLAWLVLSLILI